MSCSCGKPKECDIWQFYKDGNYQAIEAHFGMDYVACKPIVDRWFLKKKNKNTVITSDKWKN
jgi:hypothetical protein